MKKISYYILAMGVGMMALTGCNDSFLDTSSKTSSNSTSFYKTQEQANYAVIGCYDMYQRTVSNGSWPSLFQAVESFLFGFFATASTNALVTASNSPCT